MQTEMPKKYWRNLPEASLIKPLIAGAERTASAMIADAATEPHKSQKRLKPNMKSGHSPPADRIQALRDEAADCRACPLWKDATQTVFGEGPQHAQVMLVGEQPVTRRTWLANLLSDLPDKCSTVRWKRPASNGRKSMSPTR
jgi:DNA polymerase